jgi:hypothetical protein
MIFLWHWFEHVYGGDNGSGPWYLWWSGFFSDVTIFTGVYVVVRSHNCHVKGCRSFRTHPDPAVGGARACTPHHSKGHLHGKAPE